VTGSLRTTRLVLRQWRDDDAAAFAEFSADPAVMQYLVPLRTALPWTPGSLRPASIGTIMASVSAEDFDFDHPRLPPGHPLRRHVLYRLRRA
jgi:RimJ/RimL family protein N-acetyltransferase